MGLQTVSPWPRCYQLEISRCEMGQPAELVGEACERDNNPVNIGQEIRIGLGNTE
jgi:hypothetical protein